MGTCGSRNETSKEIDLSLKSLDKDLKKQIKILLLGPGESGKSTIFKQMKIIQDEGGFHNPSYGISREISIRIAFLK